MSGQELSFRLLAHQLRMEAPALIEPPSGLWPRIVAARAAQQKRRLHRRLGAVGLALAATFAVVALVPQGVKPSTDGAALTDWQGRAQVLELELRTLRQMQPMDANSELAAGAESELDQIDRDLQQAYDRSADTAELAGLWRQRSDILNTLITAQKRNRTVTRI